jgi:hypothetical protein
MDEKLQEESVEPTVEESTEVQPDTGENPSGEQSPSNFAFAKARVEKRNAENKLHEYEQKEIERNAFYAAQAAGEGFTEITTEEQYRAAMQEDQTNKTLESAGIDVKTVAAIASIVNQKPEPQIYNPKSELDELNEAHGLKLEKVEDILKLDNAGKILDLMEKGEKVLSAFNIANAQSLQNNSVNEARQEVINQAKGYSHIKQTQGGGEIETITVSQKEVENWRKFYPGVSDEALTKMAKNQKKAGW